MGLNQWLNVASSLMGSSTIQKGLQNALQPQSPVRQIGGRVLDRLLDKMGQRSPSFQKVFQQQTKALQSNPSSNPAMSGLVRHLPSVKPGAYSQMLNTDGSINIAGTTESALEASGLWATMQRYDQNNDGQMSQEELSLAINSINHDIANQSGGEGGSTENLEALHRFAVGLQQYQQSMAAFDGQPQGISLKDIGQFVARQNPSVLNQSNPLNSGLPPTDIQA